MNILIIDNGFDIAHGLPTSYEDFFLFVRLFKDYNHATVSNAFVDSDRCKPSARKN